MVVNRCYQVKNNYTTTGSCFDGALYDIEVFGKNYHDRSVKVVVYLLIF